MRPTTAHRGATKGACAVILVAALAVLVAGARALDRPYDSHFAVVVTGADPTLVSQTGEILNKAFHDMASASGVWLRDTVRVIYASGALAFDSIVGGKFPDWGVACAMDEEHLIVVRSPRDYPSAQQLPEVLRHELAHLHFATVVGSHRPPRWMNEGYAQQFAHEWRYGDDWIVSRAVFSDRTIPLADIDGVNSFRDARARLAYAESYLAMGYFLKMYGWDGFMLLGRGLRGGGSWDDGFKSATGADYATFQKEFQKHLEDQYTWASFLGDTVLLWILLVLIFLVFYLLKRRRAALKMADWNRQEQIEDVLYSPFNRPPDSRAPPADDN